MKLERGLLSLSVTYRLFVFCSSSLTSQSRASVVEGETDGGGHAGRLNGGSREVCQTPSRLWKWKWMGSTLSTTAGCRRRECRDEVEV